MKWTVQQEAFKHPSNLWSLLVVDGFGSHTMTPEALQVFRDARVLVITLPSHTSSALQPLDVACYRPLKSAFFDSVRDVQYARYVGALQKEAMNKWTIGCLLTPIYYESLNPSNIRSGFEAAGLFPFDPDWVTKHQNKLIGNHWSM